MNTEGRTLEADAPSKSCRWTPLWLALALLVTLFYAGSVPDVPTGSDLGPEYTGRGIGGGVKALVLSLPALGLALVGLVASIAATGTGGALSALRFLLGRASEAELPRASRALAAAAQLVLRVGILAGFVALLGMLDMLRVQAIARGSGTAADFESVYTNMQHARSLLFLAVPGALIVGRFLLGAPAEAAALRAGLRPPTFSSALQMATLLLIPLFVMLTLLKFPAVG